MKNQMRARGVEAADAPTAAALRAGEEFDAFLRREIREISHSGAEVPAPRQLFYDVGRVNDRRPLSIGRVGQAIQALAASPHISNVELEAFAERLAAWVRSLRTPAPTSLVSTWARETDSQADADKAQMRALHAVETHDVAALELAIEETAEQLTDTRLLLTQYTVAHRTATAQRRAGARPSARYA